MEQKFVILVGASCSGKSSIINKLLELRPDLFAVPVSATTCTKCPDEDGSEYVFMAEDEFLRLREDGGLLESAMHSGCWYGLLRNSVQAILDQGKIPIRAMEIAGAMSDMDGIDKLVIFVDRNIEACLSDLLDRDIPKEEKVRRIMRMKADMDSRQSCHAFVDNNDSLIYPVINILGMLHLPTVFDATFVSVWDEQDECRGACKVDLQSGLVFDIQPCGYTPEDGILTAELVEFDTSTEEYVFDVEEIDNEYRISGLSREE